MFKMNLQWWQRIPRLIVGSLLLIWAAAGGADWGYLGVILIATGASGYSPTAGWFKRMISRHQDFE